MKKLFLFVSIIMLAFTSKAKEFPLYFSLGTGYNYYSSQSLKEGRSSYNETYASFLSADLGSTGIPFYYEINVKYKLFENLGMSLNYSFSRNHYSAEFSDGRTRHINIRNRTPIDFGMFTGKPNVNCFEFRFGYFESTLVTDVEYKDGTRSISNMQPMNGTYNSFGFFYKLDYTRKVKGLVAIKLGIGGGTTLGGYYNDLSWAKDMDLASAEWMPTDFASYESVVASGAFYDYPEDKYWKANYFQFYAGIQVNLNKH